MATKRKRRASPKKVAYWRGCIEDWRRSGLSQAEYCRREDISTSTFWYWKRRFLVQGVALEVSPVIVPVPMERITPVAKLKPILLHIGGYSVEFQGDFNPAVLEKLLGVLDRVS